MKFSKRHEFHGLSHTPTYAIWNAMIQRCHNPKVAVYMYYGAIGITVCKRWRQSFLNFLADMGPRPRGKTLDRIRNSKGYMPSNCRWATKAVQKANRRKHPRKTTYPL